MEVTTARSMAIISILVWNASDVDLSVYEAFVAGVICTTILPALYCSNRLYIRIFVL